MSEEECGECGPCLFLGREEDDPNTHCVNCDCKECTR